MRKIVLNTCYGGFSLSLEAIKMMADLGHPKAIQNLKDKIEYLPDILRTDSILVQVVETLGEKANGPCSKLEVIELDGNEHVRIDCRDGKEYIEYIGSCMCCS